MLESARLRLGHHVLEVGSGGYNAALIAELVGRTGRGPGATSPAMPRPRSPSTRRNRASHGMTPKPA
ncbi:hypothetical protein ACSP97_32975 [Streptomyces sp. SCPE 10]|uniref:hypothetical protein n=1 Tax=Streptomyces TaxID=1883 RepID=UPI0033B3B7B3